MKLGESLELIGKRWNIFEKLSQKKYYVTELAIELEKKPPEISNNLKQLEKSGLVEHEQKEGERRKYYYISDYTSRILSAVKQATQPKPEAKLEKWQINEFLNILEDQNLSDNLRLSYSNSFYHICSEHPIEVITHKEARRLFEKVAADPFHDSAREDLMRSVSAILPHASRDEKWSGWVLRELYPVFVESMENEKADQEIRVWATRKVGRIASSSAHLSKTGEVEKKFLEIWFSDDTDPESELGKEVKQQLIDLTSKRLFENVRAKAKHQDPKVKTKAEILLKGLKECLLPK